MHVAPELARLRRRLLRRYLAEAGLDAGEVALAIGVSPQYLAKLLAGSRVVTDAVAWRLSRHVGIPFELLESPPPAAELSPQRAQTLRRDVQSWRQALV